MGVPLMAASLRQAGRGRRVRRQAVLVGLPLLAVVSLLLLEAYPARPAAGTASATGAVTYSLPSGAYDHDIDLRIATADAGSTIIFTTDGGLPTPEDSTVYRGPIHLATRPATAIVLSARALLPGRELGPVARATYLMGVASTMPVLSLMVEPDDLWSEQTGLFTHPDGRGQAWERPAELFYFDQGKLAFHLNTGLRVHGERSRGDSKKSLRLLFRQEYGQPWLEYDLFDDEVNQFKRLVLRAGGQDYPLASTNGLLVRNDLIGRLAARIDGYAVNSRPVVLFLNGALWGIFNLRERFDDHYLRSHYGIEALAVEESGWGDLTDFVASQDMSRDTSYQFVQTQIDVANYIDYVILQLYAANSDWPLFNQERFRPATQGGRWQWRFWDEDFAFGLAPRGRIDFDMVEWSFSGDNASNADALLLLNKLMENPEFYARFLARTADLLNTTFSTGSVLAEVDAVAAQYAADIDYEARRWPGASDWQAGVAYLRDFAAGRPTFLRQHLVDWFDLAEPIALAIEPPPAGSGTVAVNGQLPDVLPWQGTFFQETTIQLTAVPAPGYEFAGWQPATLGQSAIIERQFNANQTVAPRFRKSDPAAARPGDVVFRAVGRDGRVVAGQATRLFPGSWLELYVARPGAVDLRGWRITDNDTKTATDEGSLIFAQQPALAVVPQGSTVYVVFSEPFAAAANGARDDLDRLDGRLVLRTGNANLDTATDPWFNPGPNDSLALLAPGATGSFADDQGVDFVTFGASPSRDSVVTAAEFGVLQDGVVGAHLGQ